MSGKRTHLGLHDTEIEAARAYDKWAHPLGKNLNIPEDYRGQKVASLAYVLPAALPKREACAHAMSSAFECTAVEVGRSDRCFSSTGEISPQELHDLQTNTESLKRMPIKRGPPKNRSLLLTAVRTKGKSKAPPREATTKERKSHPRNAESDDSSSGNSNSNNSNGNFDSCSSDNDNSDNSNECDNKRWRSSISSKATACGEYVEENCKEPSVYELLCLQNIAATETVRKASNDKCSALTEKVATAAAHIAVLDGEHGASNTQAGNAATVAADNEELQRQMQAAEAGKKKQEAIIVEISDALVRGLVFHFELSLRFNHIKK